MDIESPPEDNSDAPQDPMRSLDAELREHFKLLYMLEPGDHLNSKLGLQDLYRTSLLTAVFCREPLTALYTHSAFQMISVIAGSYLVIRAYLRSSQYRDDQHRMVKVDTVLIQTPYQRNPTWIDFSLASCAWEENLHLVLELVQGFAIILSSLFAHFCITRAPRKIFALAGLIVGLGNLVLFIGSDGSSAYVVAYECLTTFFVSIFVFPCPILFMETFVLELIAASLSIRMIADGVNKSIKVEVLVAFVLFSLALLLKVAQKAKASQAMKEDAVKFDSAWRAMMETSASQSFLEDTDRILKDFFALYPTKSLPNCKHTFMMPESLVKEPSAGKVSQATSRSSRVLPMDSMISLPISTFTDSTPSFPVLNLDQLYARSVVVLPMFLRKVVAVGRDWRGHCCYQLPGTSEKQYMLYKDLESSPEVLRSVYLSSIKNVQRSVKKTLTFLHGDVSQLTDIVRQSILFDNLQDLNGALQQLIDDGEIEVVFIRNRLSGGGGQRDITINICFTHDLAVRTNLLGHVCELRLGLKEIHSNISPADHELFLERKLVLQTRRIERGRGNSSLVMMRQGRKLLLAFSSFLRMKMRNESSGADAVAPGQLLMTVKGMMPGGLLDFMIHSAEAGVEEAETASVMFSSRPVTNVIRKRLFQMILVVLGVAMIASWMLNDSIPIRMLWRDRQYDVFHARITVLQVRSPDAETASLGRVSFFKDCQRFTPTLVASNGTRFFFTFSSQVVVNGWEFYTDSAESSFDHDPMSLEMHVSDQIVKLDPTDLTESQWRLITKFDCALSAKTELCRSSVANVTATRGQRYYFDLRDSWQTVGEIINMGLRLLATFGTAALASMGFIFLGKTTLASSFHGAGVIDIVIAAFTPLDALGFLQSILWGLLELVYGLIVQFREEHTISFMPVYCLCGSAMNLLMTNLRQARFSLTPNTLRLDLTFPFYAWALFYLWRQYLLFKSFSKIRADLAQYQQLWQQLERDAAALAELGDSLAKIDLQPPAAQCLSRASAAATLPSTPIGLESSNKSREERTSLMRRISGRAGMMSRAQAIPRQLRVGSLEQLYAQALVILPAFFDKIKELGSRCDCLFLLEEEAEGGPRYVSWAETEEDPLLKSLIRRPALKAATRSIAKVLRSYKGDASRLTDIVRYALVFEDLGKLRRAVEVAREDPEILIARMKNRFDPSYNSMKTGGYRDICLNIRISNDYTRRNLVDSHICELQLVLKSFMELRTDKGHKNYRVFRDQRCE